MPPTTESVSRPLPRRVSLGVKGLALSHHATSDLAIAHLRPTIPEHGIQRHQHDDQSETNECRLKGQVLAAKGGASMKEVEGNEERCEASLTVILSVLNRRRSTADCTGGASA